MRKVHTLRWSGTWLRVTKVPFWNFPLQIIPILCNFTKMPMILALVYSSITWMWYRNPAHICHSFHCWASWIRLTLGKWNRPRESDLLQMSFFIMGRIDSSPNIAIHYVFRLILKLRTPMGMDFLSFDWIIKAHRTAHFHIVEHSIRCNHYQNRGEMFLLLPVNNPNILEQMQSKGHNEPIGIQLNTNSGDVSLIPYALNNLKKRCNMLTFDDTEMTQIYEINIHGRLERIYPSEAWLLMARWREESMY